MGGDATLNTWISIDPPNTRSPTNNAMSFLTGATDEDATRQYGLWNGQTFANVAGSEYTTTNGLNSTYVTAPAAINPWNAKHYMQGTDGRQFAPDLKKGAIQVFDPSVSRTMAFEWTS